MSERCVGCRAEADEHPIVGIGQSTDALKDYQLPNKVWQGWRWVATAQSTRGFVAYPVCKNCWSNPAHRQRILKLSFFDRKQLPEALVAAGSNVVRA